MNNGKVSSFQVKDLYRKTKDSLNLRPVLGKTGFSRKINKSFLDKSSLPVQIWGKREIQDLKSLSSEERREFLKKKLKNNILCIILSDGFSFSQEIEEEARKRRLSLFCSDLSRQRCREGIKKFFPQLYRTQCLISGGLLQISGLGILILGDSGIGKSESALELISRGSLFVSDDVVSVEKTRNGKLIGKALPLSRYFMEIRGLGIINIKEIFGSRAISKQAEINLVIQLKRWEQGKEYDRLGLRFSECYKILRQKVPQITIPVAPGRNIATLIEVACKVRILKEKGYHAPLEIARKLNRALLFR